MNFEYFISKNIIRKGRENLSAPAIRIAIISVALGLSTMIIAISVLHGFQREIRDKVAGFAAHITVSSYDFNKSLESTPVMKEQSFLQNLKTMEGIHHVQVFATKGGILKTDEQMEGVILKGVGMDYNWESLDKWLVEGRMLELYDSVRSTEVLVSSTIADKLELKLGDDVRMYFVTEGQKQPRGRKFEIVGIYSSGLEDFDAHFLYGDIRQIQRLNNWPEVMVSGFEIMLDDFGQLDKIAAQIKPYIGYNLKIETIKETQEQIFSWLELTDMNVAVILVLIFIVTAFSMISAILILILERTGMIGILKALGANNAKIQGVFILNALYIIGIGLFWGNLFGIGLCLLQYYFQIIPLDVASYYVSAVPIKLDLLLVFVLNIFTLLVCALVMLSPAWIISRISPVKAIRFK